MKINHKENKTAKFLKGILFIAFLGLVSGCGGGGGGSTPGLPTADNGTSGTTGTIAGESSILVSNPLNKNMDLCTEVNGWETGCRFLGMQYLKMNETITPLTEEFSGQNRGRGGDA